MNTKFSFHVITRSFISVITLSSVLMSAHAEAKLENKTTTPVTANFVAGTDYTIVANPSEVEKKGQPEVREFFWYGCPHCFKLEPFVTAWRKTKPVDVNFILTPAALNPVWEQNARGFYVSQMLGVLDKVHDPLFNEINVNQNRLFDQASLASFYTKYGVDAAKFNGLYNSFAVTGKIAQSKALAMQYQIDGVPALIVNGKYLVRGENGRSLQVVDYLIAKDRKTKK